MTTLIQVLSGRKRESGMWEYFTYKPDKDKSLCTIVDDKGQWRSNALCRLCKAQGPWRPGGPCRGLFGALESVVKVKPELPM